MVGLSGAGDGLLGSAGGTVGSPGTGVGDVGGTGCLGTVGIGVTGVSGVGEVGSGDGFAGMFFVVSLFAGVLSWALKLLMVKVRNNVAIKLKSNFFIIYNLNC